MIQQFRCKETERIFQRLGSKKLPKPMQPIALRKLAVLDAAETLEELKIPPANRLEKLKGKRKGQYSIRINDQWRVCFTWTKGNAYNVEIVDYH
jgi:proteic killer suppression protein